jgi:hypothetical protein
MFVMYRLCDDEVSQQQLQSRTCELCCYVKCFNPSRRFHYCENCETAFHRLDYKIPTGISSRQSNLTAPLTQMIQNPTAKASLHLDSQYRFSANTRLHAQLLGHALHCSSEICEYRGCHLMQVSTPVPTPKLLHILIYYLYYIQRFLWPHQKSRKRSRVALTAKNTDTSEDISGSGSKRIFPTNPSTRLRSSLVPEVSAPLRFVDEDGQASREQLMDRAVGLSDGCRVCIRAANILYKHEQMCTSRHCTMLYCADLKRINAQSVSASNIHI